MKEPEFKCRMKTPPRNTRLRSRVYKTSITPPYGAYRVQGFTRGPDGVDRDNDLSCVVIVRPRKIPPGCARVVSLMQAGHRLWSGLFGMWLTDPRDKREQNVKLQVSRALLARGLIRKGEFRQHQTIQEYVLTTP